MKRTRLISLALLIAMVILAIPVVTSAEAMNYTKLSELYESQGNYTQFLAPFYSKSDAPRKGDPQSTRIPLATKAANYAKLASGEKVFVDFDFLVTEKPFFPSFRTYDQSSAKNKINLFSISTISEPAALENPWKNEAGWHHLTIELTQEGAAAVLNYKMFADGELVLTGVSGDVKVPFYTLDGENQPAPASADTGFYFYFGSAAAVAVENCKGSVIKNCVLGIGTENPNKPIAVDFELNGGKLVADDAINYDVTVNYSASTMPYATNTCKDESLMYNYTIDFVNKNNYYTADAVPALADLPVATREGADFAGWFLDKNCTQALTAENLNAVFAGEAVTLYAGWNVSNGVESASVTIDRDLKLNFYTKAVLGADETLTAKFTMNGNTTVASGTVLGVEDGVSSVKFTVDEIGPHNVADVIDAKFYVGEDLKFSVEYSVLDYLKELNGTSTDPKVLALVDALMSYAKSATKYQGKSVTAYDVLLTEVTPVEGEKSLPVNSGVATIKSANVLFDCQNKIIVKFETEADIATVPVQINGENVTPVSLGGNLYSVTTEGIDPTHFGSAYNFTIGTSTLSYSVNAYAIAMKDNAEISALTNAMYGYGVAAYAYIPK